MTSDTYPSLASGRYRLVSVLGTGGMATVYRGYDTELDVYRAIKVLAPELAVHTKVRERFQREARTMAKMIHPNIVMVLDVGRDADRRLHGDGRGDRRKPPRPAGPHRRPAPPFCQHGGTAGARRTACRP